MTRQRKRTAAPTPPGDDLPGFACPNEDCGDFNRFAAGNRPTSTSNCPRNTFS